MCIESTGIANVRRQLCSLRMALEIAISVLPKMTQKSGVILTVDLETQQKFVRTLENPNLVQDGIGHDLLAFPKTDFYSQRTLFTQIRNKSMDFSFINEIFIRGFFRQIDV